MASATYNIDMTPPHPLLSGSFFLNHQKTKMGHEVKGLQVMAGADIWRMGEAVISLTFILKLLLHSFSTLYNNTRNTWNIRLFLRCTSSKTIG